MRDAAKIQPPSRQHCALSIFEINSKKPHSGSS